MSIELLPNPTDKTIALKMDGYLSTQDIDRVVAEIEPQLQDARERVRLFVEIDSFGPLIYQQWDYPGSHAMLRH